MIRAICADARDNVATLLETGRNGDKITVETGLDSNTATLQSDVPAFHKFALRNIATGEVVIKYGESIGKAVCRISAGEHVHVHNIESGRGRGDLES